MPRTPQNDGSNNDPNFTRTVSPTLDPTTSSTRLAPQQPIAQPDANPSLGRRIFNFFIINPILAVGRVILRLFQSTENNPPPAVSDPNSTQPTTDRRTSYVTPPPEEDRDNNLFGQPMPNTMDTPPSHTGVARTNSTSSASSKRTDNTGYPRANSNASLPHNSRQRTYSVENSVFSEIPDPQPSAPTTTPIGAMIKTITENPQTRIDTLIAALNLSKNEKLSLSIALQTTNEATLDIAQAQCNNIANIAKKISSSGSDFDKFLFTQILIKKTSSAANQGEWMYGLLADGHNFNGMIGEILAFQAMRNTHRSETHINKLLDTDQKRTEFLQKIQKLQTKLDSPDLTTEPTLPGMVPGNQTPSTANTPLQGGLADTLSQLEQQPFQEENHYQ